MAEITRATPDMAGCYIDGHWGQYGVAHMVERAQEFGYSEPEVIALAARHMNECAHGGVTSEETAREGPEKRKAYPCSLLPG